MIALVVAAQAVMSVPVAPAPRLAPVTTGYSIVVARAVEQNDPLPIPCGSDFCTSWFLGSFDEAKTLAGAPLPRKFKARLEMGSPYGMRYRLLLLVAPDADGTLRVRSASGFDVRTNESCLDAGDTAVLSPEPASADLVRRGKAICTIDR